MPKLAYGTPQEAGLDPDRIAVLKDRASEWVDGNRMRSSVLLAARRGKIVFHEAYGPLTEKADSPPLQKDSIFSISSCSKPVTATAIMILVERGQLGLNRPITEYIPSLIGEGIEGVEVQHLLTHTAGFSDEALQKKFDARWPGLIQNGFDVPPGQDALVAMMLGCQYDTGPTWAPGSRMEYDNFGYVCLGEIVRVVSGQSLDVFADEHIFAPLGMVDSTYVRDDTKLERWVQRGIDPVAGRIEGNPDAGLEGNLSQNSPHGGGGVNSTAMDLARFAQMSLNLGTYDGNTLLSKSAVHEMTRNQIQGLEAVMVGKSVEASWGLGWMIQSNRRWRWGNGTLTPVGSFGHPGIGGHHFWIDPENEIVGVYLSVCHARDLERSEHHWNLDLFQNMVTAAVVD